MIFSQSRILVIITNYTRLSPEKFAELQNNPELAEEFFSGESVPYQDMASVYRGNIDRTKTHVSLEKEWQAIHYLLTGEVACDESQAEPPLSKLIFGGTPTEFEAGYGYVRYLSSTEVKELSQALHQVKREDLRARFEARGETEIYAQEDEWDEETWLFFLAVLDFLVLFFHEAAANNEMVLISSD